MPYSEHLAERIAAVLRERKIRFEEKKMMGGICFMVDDKMCCGVVDEKLMARIGPDVYEEALDRPGCSEMNFTGRPMKGYVFVQDEGIDMDDDLDYWIELCLDFNPKAKSSKK